VPKSPIAAFVNAQFNVSGQIQYKSIRQSRTNIQFIFFVHFLTSAGIPKSFENPMSRNNLFLRITLIVSIAVAPPSSVTWI
jgi:hypothetical protein